MPTDHVELERLIRQVLPLERLPRAARTTRALRSVTVAPLEAVAELAFGASPAGATVENEAETERRRGAEPRPAARPVSLPDGVLAVHRTALPENDRVAPGQIRRLLRLGDPMLASDPRRIEARADLVRHLERAAHEVLGPVAVKLVSTEDAAGEDVAREALARPDTILCTRGATPHGGAGVWLGLVSARGEPLGVLEVFGLGGCDDADLALVALLGDYAAGVLERAARVESLVFVDPLTGAYNRSYFEIQMHNEIARAQRDRSGMGVCIADIDDFKSFNTRFGYEGGNQVLMRVAQTLRNGVRPFDTVARWGGEEFAVLLSAPVQPQDVVTVAERLRGLVERLSVPIVGLDGNLKHVRVSTSIGAALFPVHGETPDDLWRTANVALLEAKKPPKNRVVFGG